MAITIQRVLLILITVVGLSIFYLNFSRNNIITNSTVDPNSSSPEQKSSLPQPKTVEKYQLDTPGCKIPLLDPYHPSLKRFIKDLSRKKLICKGEQLVLSDGKMLKLNKKAIKKRKNVTCQYNSLHRKNENTVIHDKAYPITGEIVIRDEFVRVECYQSGIRIYQDFFPFLIRKPAVEKRCKKSLEKYTNVPKLNVLLLGVDSVSKNQYRRNLRRTDDYIRKNLPFIELQGYNKVGLNTFPNMVPLTTGKSVVEFKTDFEVKNTDSLPIIWKNFADKGYRTLFAEETPAWTAMFNFQKRGFSKQPTDYYYRPFSIAAEKSKIVKGLKTGCYPNRTESSVVLKWTKDFFDEFKNDPVFAYSFLSRLSHDNYNSVAYEDEPLMKMLQYLNDKGHLNKTIVFFFSDHGFRFGEVRLTYVGHVEEKLPFAFVILPKWFESASPVLYANLKLNENRLVTPFDMYATMNDILDSFTNIKKYSSKDRSVSLFTPISPNRNCEIANIDSLYCACVDRQQISIKSSRVEKSANLLVDSVNKMMAKYRNLCAKLKLNKIVEASSKRSVISVGKINESYEINYEITVEVNPSKAVFQGVVLYNGKSEKLSVEPYIDRLNQYGNQSHCIDHAYLKPFCFCD